MEMCRVCLTTEKEMHQLDESFIVQYNLLTNLNITLLDGMPQYTCKICLNTVKFYIEFREKCIASEATLREIICSTLKAENKNDDVPFDGESVDIPTFTDVCVNEDNLKAVFKTEVKIENIEDNDSVFDNYDAGFEESTGDIIKNLVKDKEEKPKKIRKKRKHKDKTVANLDRNSLMCGLCPEIFQEQNDLATHLDTHKDDRQCKLCKENVSCLSQLLAHRLMHVPIKQYKCHICSKRFKSSLYMEHHYRSLHIESDDPNLICKICRTSYNSPKRLNGHMLQVHSTVCFVCDVCSKGFASKTNLKSHIKHHSEIKSYVCDLCGFSCNYSGGLKDHKVRRHSQKKIYCKTCSRAFGNQQDYDRHNCKNKLHVCTICGLQVAGSSRLSRHMARHSNVLKYECKRCPAKFKTKGGLVAHNNRHDGNRTKHCEFCDAKFYTATVLIKHRRIHTGERPYVCKVCNKGFTGNHNLKVHMKVHGEYLIVKKNNELDINILDNVTK